MLIRDLLAKLAKKAGLDTTQPEWADLLASNLEINDGIGTAIDGKLMTADIAFNNADLRAKFKNLYYAEALNGVDSKFANIAEQLKLSDEELIDFNAQGTTFKKTDWLLKKAKDLAEKPATGNGKKEQELVDTINKLNQDKAKLIADHDGVIKGLKDSQETELINYMMMTDLAARTYALPDEMPAEMKTSIALAALQREATAKGYVIKRDNGQLVLLTKDGTKPIKEDDNTEIGLKDFTDGVLHTNKLLKVSDGGEPQTKTRTVELPGNEKAPTNQGAAADMEAQAKSMMP